MWKKPCLCTLILGHTGVLHAMSGPQLRTMTTMMMIIIEIIPICIGGPDVSRNIYPIKQTPCKFNIGISDYL